LPSKLEEMTFDNYLMLVSHGENWTKFEAMFGGTRALETLLMLMVNIYADEAEATGMLPKRKNKPRDLIDRDLSQLLKIAKAAGWLPSDLELTDDWSNRKAKIGDYAEVARMVRNLVHPGYYVKDHARSRGTAKYLKQQFEVVGLCRDWLAERNNRSLREHMLKEDL
jgi:hypothetical protein